MLINKVKIFLLFFFFLLFPLFYLEAAGADCWTKNACELPQEKGGGGGIWDDKTPECSSLRKTNCCEKGQGWCYTKSQNIDLKVSIGGKTQVQDIADYIAAIYKYGLGLVGILVVIMIMAGGFFWISAGGSPERVNKGRELISNALIGLVLALSSYLILQTINPDLVNLSMPRIKVMRKMEFGGCLRTELEVGRSQSYIKGGPYRCGQSYGLIHAQPKEKSVDGYIITKANDSLSVETCISKDCSQDGGNETNRCKSTGGGGYKCTPCKKNKEICETTGRNDECCSGFCADVPGVMDKCAGGKAGDDCDSNNECLSGLCQTNLTNSCSEGLAGSPCSSDDECRGGNICMEGGRNYCSPGTAYSRCENKEDCRNGFWCKRPLNAADPSNYLSSEYFCLPQGTTSLSSCSTKQDCASQGGYCYKGTFCTNGSSGSPCENSKECGSGYCNTQKQNICTAGQPGEGCSNDKDCVSGHCYSGKSFGVCVTGLAGSACDSDSDCPGLKCFDNRCL